MPFTVRRAVQTDAPAFLALVRALADYEELARPTPEAEQRLVRDGWPEDSVARFSAWLVEYSDGGDNTAAIGYAITFYTYSSFLARPTLYIEDIFILPGSRRGGAGSALFRALRTEAESHGCGRMEWVVLDWNTSAQQFYRRLGAEHLSEWHYYRLSLAADESL